MKALTRDQPLPSLVAPTVSAHWPRPKGVVSEMPWKADAACRGMDPDLFHPQTGWSEHAEAHGPVVLGQVEAAKAVCSTCPVRQECLDYALAAGETEGVWGGLDPRERYRMRRGRRAS